MIVQRWHDWVNQPKHDKAWHEQDIADELAELREARGIVSRWSEMSDIVYTVTRGRWSGHDLSYPIPKSYVLLGHIYMYPKYTSRAVFFRRAGKKAGARKLLQSVRNPKKVHKLETIATENGIDPAHFVKVCEDQLRRWPLLP